MANLIGLSLGRYHILEQLGEGGMAEVYKAYDTRLERNVAVKVIRVNQFAPAVLDRILKRFDREAKALAKLTHPNIVKVLDYGEQDGIPYLVMDYLSGGTLKARLGKPIPWQEAARQLIPVSEALGFAHENGIVHRDIKPANILLTGTGQLMLTDFGIAKILESEETLELTGTGVGIGTPEYMAPEQTDSKNVDQRADIYALGIVFYEMITGRRPYEANTPLAVLIKQASEPLPSPRVFVPALPQEVENVLIRLLAKRPEYRYQNMAEFTVALRNLLSGIPGTEEKTWIVNRGDIESRQGTQIALGQAGTNTPFFPDSARIIPAQMPARAEPPPGPYSQVSISRVPTSNKKVFLFGIIGVAGVLILGLVALIAILAINFMNHQKTIGVSTPIEKTNPGLPVVTESQVSPTFTSLPNTPTFSPEPNLPSPTDTLIPQVVTPTHFADKNYLCLEGPAISYQHAVDVYLGSTHTIIGRSQNNPGWYQLAINQTNTHHTCCWIKGGEISGDLALAQYTEALCP